MRFGLGENDYFIEEIVHQWLRAPDRAHFRVRAGAGVQALAGLGFFLRE